MKIDNNGIEFHPMLVMADGRRAFSIEDISEDDYLKLQNLELEKLPLILRARIADILWVNKKNLLLQKLRPIHIGNYLFFGMRLMKILLHLI